MSAGEFVRAKYESNSGRVYNIRIQPETQTLAINSVANASPSGPVTEEVSAKVSGSKRSIGMNARTVTLEWATAPPAGYSDGIVRVVILQESTYDAITPGATGTYQDSAVIVVGKSPEVAR